MGRGEGDVHIRLCVCCHLEEASMGSGELIKSSFMSVTFAYANFMCDSLPFLSLSLLRGTHVVCVMNDIQHL